MNTEPKKPDSEKEPSSLPANSGIDIPQKASLPDEDRTRPGKGPTNSEIALKGPGEESGLQEHRTGRDHAEPTDVTGTANDNEIDSEYIDVGGGEGGS